MKYIMYWELPVDKRQDAMFVLTGLKDNPLDDFQVQIYWAADSTAGHYTGVGILETNSEESLYEFFGLVQGIAEIRVVPAVGEADIVKMWARELHM